MPLIIVISDVRGWPVILIPVIMISVIRLSSTSMELRLLRCVFIDILPFLRVSVGIGVALFPHPGTVVVVAIRVDCVKLIRVLLSVLHAELLSSDDLTLDW